MGASDFLLGGGKWLVSFVRFVSRLLGVFLVQFVYKNASNMQPDKPDKPDICFPDPDTAIRVFREGQDDGVVRFVRSVRRGLGGDLGFCYSKTGQTCNLTKLTKLTVPSLAPASRVELRTCPESKP